MKINLHIGDCLQILPALPAESVHCVVTSPPYWGLRDYGVEGQIGLERDYTAYIERLIEVFRAVRRVLRKDGTAWLNLGDAYNGYMANQRATSISANNQGARPFFESGHGPRTRGLKPKDLCMIPARVALALQADGWWLRSEIIWHKPNPMPESVTDRPTSAHEKIYLLSKSQRYYYDAEAAAEPAVKAGQVLHSYGTGAKDRQDVTEVNDRRTRIGLANWNKPVPETKNLRNVWSVTTKPFPGAHFATFPPDLIEPCIKAGCPEGGVVLDPFGGAGTTGLVADRLGRDAILIELNPEYAILAKQRIETDGGMFTQVALEAVA